MADTAKTPEQIAAQNRAENQVAMKIMLALLVVVVLAVLAVVSFGVKALGFMGLALTIIVFAVMLLFTASS